MVTQGGAAGCRITPTKTRGRTGGFPGIVVQMSPRRGDGLWLVKVHLCRRCAQGVFKMSLFRGGLAGQALEIGGGLRLQSGRLSSLRAVSTALPPDAPTLLALPAFTMICFLVMNPGELDENVCRDLEKLGKLLGMHFTDGAFRVDDVGYVASGFENRKEVSLLQTPLFHQIHQHLVRTRIRQWIVLLFVVLDKTNHQVKGGVLLRGAMLTLVHQLFNLRQHAFMLFVRCDHARQDFRQYSSVFLVVDD